MRMLLTALALSAGTTVAMADTDVQNARAAAAGSIVDINEAVVIGAFDTVGSSSVASFYVRDTTDAFGAINVFLSQSEFDSLGLAIGDVVSVLGGEKDSFNGFAEVTFPSSISIVGSPSMSYDASAIATTVSDFQNGSATAEGLESQRVQVSAIFADAGDIGNAWAGGTNYTFNDGSQFFTVRVATNEIADYMNANFGNIGSGAIALEGIFGQYDNTDSGNGYQLLVDSVVPSPATAGLLGLGGLVATRRRRA